MHKINDSVLWTFFNKKEERKNKLESDLNCTEEHGCPGSRSTHLDPTFVTVDVS